MNKVILIGRVVADPEVRYSQSNVAIAHYTLAVDRMRKKDGEQTADFIQCVALGKQGEFAEKYLCKGMKIAVVGSWQTGSYTNKSGQKVYTNECLVNEHHFCERKNGNTNFEKTNETTDLDGFVNVPDGVEDEDLPFN